MLYTTGLDAMAFLLAGKRYPTRKLEEAWRSVLLTHFHDIITGSCVHDSREHTMGPYSEAQAVAGTAREKAGLRLCAGTRWL
jgi:alpha-mannosidase